MAMLISPDNRLGTSPAYQKIMHVYNEELKVRGKVNNKKFYENHIAPEIPNYTLQAFYNFVKRFKLEHGLSDVEVMPTPVAPPKSETVNPRTGTEVALANTMRANGVATAVMIQSILNISADAAKKIAEDPSLLTQKERVELGIKVMKAQDSRIHAVGKIREDNREQERFDRAFDGAAFG